VAGRVGAVGRKKLFGSFREGEGHGWLGPSEDGNAQMVSLVTDCGSKVRNLRPNF